MAAAYVATVGETAPDDGDDADVTDGVDGCDGSVVVGADGVAGGAAQSSPGVVHRSTIAPFAAILLLGLIVVARLMVVRA